MIKDDGTVIHFNNPKVQASLSANTFAITGHAEAKPITEMLPGILSQLGADSLTSLRKLAEQFPRQGRYFNLVPLFLPTLIKEPIYFKRCLITERIGLYIYSTFIMLLVCFINFLVCFFKYYTMWHREYFGRNTELRVVT